MEVFIIQITIGRFFYYIRFKNIPRIITQTREPFREAYTIEGLTDNASKFKNIQDCRNAITTIPQYYLPEISIQTIDHEYNSR